ncbi:MAG: LptF/LptG family permease [bacterium]
MKILDKVILREIVPNFFFGVLTFTSLIVGVGAVLKFLRLAMDYNTSAIVVAQLFLLKMPEIVTYTLPMSTLFCILLGFSRLSGDLEITAFRSAGQSFYRLMVPVTIFAFLISLAGLIMSDKVVPASNERFSRIIQKETSGGDKKREGMNVFYKNSDDGELKEIVYANSLHGNNMDEVLYQEYREGRLWRATMAEEAEWLKHSWKFVNGRRYEFAPSGELKNVVRFEELHIIILMSPAELIQHQKQPDSLSLREMRERIAYLKRENVMERDVRKLQVDYHAKMAIPFASFMFALIAAPLGLRPIRAGTSIGLGISVIIIFFYYALQQIFRILGQGWLEPALAAWLPNLILLALGAMLIKRANR